MNEADMENLLRKTPRLNIAKGLEGKLREDIRLPSTVSAQSNQSGLLHLLKHWLPATICLVFALTAIAVQFKTLVRLKEENAALQFMTQNLEQLRRDNLEYKKLMLASGNIERLRKDDAELVKLRAEVAQLRVETVGLENLRAENKTLETSFIANANSTNDFFAEQQVRAERATCVNNLKQIGLAARIWAGDHQEVYPPDFISMKDELGTPRVLICPTDKLRKVNTDTWADVAAGNVSYQMDAPAIKLDKVSGDVVFASCPIHHNFCLVEGSVHMLNAGEIKKSFKVIDGRKVFVRP